jgi:superfamily II DNA or RNA helicase
VYLATGLISHAVRMTDRPPTDACRSDACENHESPAHTHGQNLHTVASRQASARDSPITRGMHLRVRKSVWLVDRVDQYATCRLVSLLPVRRAPEAAAVALLAPFDRMTPVRQAPRWRAGGPRHAIAQLARALRDTAAGGAGQSLGPELTLVPWQWTAAVALLRGDASRLLLADAVGLGKTIQAGLAISAVRARGKAARVLVLTPAGLRDQWQQEIERLFQLRCTIADAAWLRAMRRAMPADVNPWRLAITVIASIDFVKQPELLAAAAGSPWDVLIVDEAHALGARTDRRAAAAALASCARHVLLLTATPHGGNEEDFQALLSVGRLPGETARPLIIRRTRADVGLDRTRRARVARVALGRAELRMHALLREYAGAVWRQRGTCSPAARLAMTVLLKRAASSAWALHCSVLHRVRLLGPEDDLPAQPPLPFEDPGETDCGDTEVPAALGEAGLDERGRELEMLVALSDAARVAAGSESKIARVATVLRRTPEPAIVFTEYRDTLQAALLALGPCGSIAVLHGGLSRVARQLAEREFTRGHARVLLATDAASEGLNLHGRCRLVINLELPWNPVRLEQRIGRVDRIGQTRRVHAVHMVGSDTAESYVFTRLAARVQTIRRSLGEASDATGITEGGLAAGALGETDPEPVEPAAAHPLFTPSVRAQDAAERACRLLEAARRLDRSVAALDASALRGDSLPLVILRPRSTARLGLAPGILLGFRVDAGGTTSAPAAAHVLALHVQLPRGLLRARPSTLIAGVLPMARASALREAAVSMGADLEAHRASIDRARAREASLLAAIDAPGAGGPPLLLQPGLFDRRAVHEAARQQAARGYRRELHAARLAQLDEESREALVWSAEPILALVLR